MFSKGTAQPVVSAVTQVTKAHLFSENYTRKFNNAKTAFSVTFPPFFFFQKKWKQEVAKAHWFLQSRRTIIIVAYVERVL